MAETDLYPPVKAYLEAQGYEVKGEVQGCDVVARRGDEPPVIVELKTAMSLALVLQGVRRLALTDAVYLATPPQSGKAARQQTRDLVALCKRVGLGLMAVRCAPNPGVEILCDPLPYQPRKSKRRQTRLLGEFERRVGDPTRGGASTRAPRMTAYRQDALRCARHLSRNGPSRGAEVAHATGVVKATALMYGDHYGWFDRPEKGIYALSPKGQNALIEFAEALERL